MLHRSQNPNSGQSLTGRQQDPTNPMIDCDPVSSQRGVQVFIFATLHPSCRCQHTRNLRPRGRCDGFHQLPSCQTTWARLY